MMMRAIWSEDYDFRTDSTFKRPCCPECCEPIGLDGSDKYRCFSCGEVVEVIDPEMLKWFGDRKEVKYEYQDCLRIPMDDDGKEFIGCGGKGTVKVMMVRNNVTLEWQSAQGKCERCGLVFIV